MYDDRELVEKTLQGEKRAFEMIVRKYQQPLANYIGRMVGERELALDFTQEVFVKVYTSLPSYRPQFKFGTWLFKIASNTIIDYWRKKKIRASSLDHPVSAASEEWSLQVPDDEPSVVRKYELAELRDKIEHVLERLPESLRELFVWRHINGLSYDEMADIKGLPVGTVKNRVFQAKEMIRRLLGENP